MKDESDQQPMEPYLAKGNAALAWAVKSGAAGRIGETSLELARDNRKRRRQRFFAGGASLAVVLCALMWFRSRAAKPERLPPSVVVTIPPTQVLTDGTVVELRGDAEIATRFTAMERRVELQRGTAHFKVAPDPKNPFVVVARGIEAKAIGTAFSVEIREGGVEIREGGVDIVVTEGRVQVGSQVVLAGIPAAILSAGQGASVTPAADAKLSAILTPEPLSREAVDEKLAWRAPKIEFSGTPLAEAVQVFNRYSSVKLVLGDASLAKVELSGILKPDSPDAILRILRNDFDIVAEPPSGGEIRLRRR